MTYLLSLVAGVGVGYLSFWYGWSRTKTVCVGFSVGVLIGLMGSFCYGSELAFSKLSRATLNISIGTGFVLEGPSGKHYLLTNAHVCNSGSWMHRMRANYEGGKLVEGFIVKLDFLKDLCATKIPKQSSPLKLSDKLLLDESVYTRGYPLGVLSETSGHLLGREVWRYTYEIGQVGECFKGSKKERDGLGHVTGCAVTYTDNITDMYARPGASGSPVVNSNGDLVGVMSSWMGDKDAGGMVKFEDIKEFIKDL